MNKYDNQKDIKTVANEDSYGGFTVGSFFLVVALFFTFFFGWIFVQNFEQGDTEIGMNGWNFICLSFCWAFKSSNVTAFGKSYIFYYYEPGFVVTLTILTMLVFYISIALLVMVFRNIKRNSQKITRLVIILSFVDALLLLACFVTGLFLNATPLTRSQWCSNPACGSMSLAIIPALVVFGNGLLNLFFRKRLLRDQETED